MYLHENKLTAAENCPNYESSNPVITELSFMSLSCISCVNYNNGKCSKGIADEINNIISVN